MGTPTDQRLASNFKMVNRYHSPQSITFLFVGLASMAGNVDLRGRLDLATTFILCSFSRPKTELTIKGGLTCLTRIASRLTTGKWRKAETMTTPSSILWRCLYQADRGRENGNKRSGRTKRFDKPIHWKSYRSRTCHLLGGNGWIGHIRRGFCSQWSSAVHRNDYQQRQRHCKHAYAYRSAARSKRDDWKRELIKSPVRGFVFIYRLMLETAYLELRAVKRDRSIVPCTLK